MKKKLSSFYFKCFIPMGIFFLIVLNTYSFAENTITDSLKTIVENPNSNAALKSSAYLQLARIYETNDKGKSLKYALKLLTVAKENDDASNSLNALELIINLYDGENDFENSINYAHQAIDISKEINAENDVAYFSGLCGGLCIKTGKYFEALQSYQLAVKLSQKNKWVHREASFLNNMGGVYYLLGDNITALDFYIKSYNLKEKNKDTRLLIPGLINIGGIYSIIGEHKKALEYLRKALRFSEENQDDYYSTKALISIADVNVKLKNFELAAKFYEEALAAGAKLEDLTVRSNILSKIGSLNLKIKQWTRAIEFSQEALLLSDSIDYPYGVSIACQQLGTAYLSLGNYKKAESFFLKALSVSQKINAVENQLDNYKSLSDLYRQSNNPKEALKFFTTYVNIKDSIFNDESHKKYSAVKAKYKLEKKQSELDHLKLENELNELRARHSRYLMYGILGLLVLIMLLAYIVFRQNKIKSLQKTIRLEQKLLRSRINPHFVFNALTVVQRFIIEKSTLTASDYLASFSHLIRFILHSSAVDAISIKEEIDFLNNYLELQRARFENRFTFKINLDEEIEETELLIPPMLIQPMVENAVEHGISNLESDGVIEIGFLLKGDKLKVTVTDNGIGRKKAGEIASLKRKNHKSVSMEITQKRLMNLSNAGEENVNLKYFDLTNEKGHAAGTKVEILIPFTFKGN